MRIVQTPVTLSPHEYHGGCEGLGCVDAEPADALRFIIDRSTIGILRQTHLDGAVAAVLAWHEQEVERLRRVTAGLVEEQFADREVCLHPDTDVEVLDDGTLRRTCRTCPAWSTVTGDVAHLLQPPELPVWVRTPSPDQREP